jgi:SAM-dependent methyltransferase
MKHERFDTTDRNAAIFMAPAVAKHYGNPAPFAAEAMILIRHKEAFAGKRVLDLGVGAGRNTQYLAPFAANYLGIDLSPANAGSGACALSRCALRRHGFTRDRQAPAGEFRFHLRSVKHFKRVQSRRADANHPPCAQSAYPRRFVCFFRS